MPAKSELRREIRKRLRGLSAQSRQDVSAAICRTLEQEIARHFSAGVNVLCFASTADEVDLWPLFQHRKTQWRFFFPRIQDLENKAMDAVEAAPENDFTPNTHLGILEPNGTSVLSPQELDLVLVPALAIDGAGNRLGHGQGFYDRFLAETRPDCQKWAVIFDLQKVERIPVNPYDVRMNAVITERGFLPFSSS